MAIAGSLAAVTALQTACLRYTKNTFPHKNICLRYRERGRWLSQAALRSLRLSGNLPLDIYILICSTHSLFISFLFISTEYTIHSVIN